MDRIFRLPRVWSNQELKKFASSFSGDVVNVSAWNDGDKEGACYRDYFTNAGSYTITNYRAEARGLQGFENELFLDLTKDLPEALINRFDVVFNHTVLEHIFEVEKAFENLCLLSRDVVILVVPFLQKMHADYGDYWRFTPEAVKKLFERNGSSVQYLSFNSHLNASVYIFCIGTKNPEKWRGVIPYRYAYEAPVKRSESENFIGCNAVVNYSLVDYLKLGLELLGSKVKKAKRGQYIVRRPLKSKP